MKRIAALLFLILISPVTEAQREFEPGYVLRTGNDTLFGWIRYKGNKSNARKCFFINRDDSLGPVVEYSPSEVSGYRFENGKYYIPKIVKGKNTEELLFLEYLLNGKVDLFYYRDDNGDEHYLIEKEELGLLPLQNDEKDIYLKDGFTYRQPSNKYIGILKVTFAEDPEISKEAEQTSLSHKSLIRISRKYHERVCPGESCIIYEKKIPGIIVYLGPSAGAGLSFISRIGNDFEKAYNYFEDGTWEPSVAPSAGFRMLLNLSVLNERIYIEYDFSIQPMTSHMTNEQLDPVYLITLNTDVLEKRWMACNRVMFRYELARSRIRPVLLAGGYIGFGFANTYHRHTDAYVPTGAWLYSEDDDTDPFHNLLYGISLGTGIQWKLNNKIIQLDLVYTSALGLFDKLNTNLINLELGIPFRL